MQRFLLSDISFEKNISICDVSIHHQLTRVLRVRVGDTVIFFDGKTLCDYLYLITSIDKTSLTCQYIKEIQKYTDIKPEIHLYQGLPHKGEKIRYIIEKGVEVGYRSFTFFPTQHSQNSILSDNKMQRFQKIAQEAVEQCGGNIMPDIQWRQENIITAPQKQSLDDNVYFFHTSGDTMKQLADIKYHNNQDIHIYVGPEGGFSLSEVDIMQQKGYTGVYLGSRIFRCETVSSIVGFYMKQCILYKK